MVNILVCSGNFNKHFEYKLIASRDLRATLEQGKIKTGTSLAAIVPVGIGHWGRVAQQYDTDVYVNMFML